jgi:hypothetical protein
VKERRNTHERIGRVARANRFAPDEPAAGDRRIAVTSPRRCTAPVPDNPARGEAQGRIGLRLNVRRGHGPQTGVEAQKSTPSHPRPIAFADLDFSNRRSVTPTKINRGGSRRHERHVGPDQQKCCAKERIPDATAFVARRVHLARPEQSRRVHPLAGANLRRERTPRAPSGDRKTRGKDLCRPARSRIARNG